MTKIDDEHMRHVRALDPKDRMAMLIVSVCETRRETGAMITGQLGLIAMFARYLNKPDRMCLAEAMRDCADHCENLEQEQDAPVD